MTEPRNDPAPDREKWSVIRNRIRPAELPAFLYVGDWTVSSLDGFKPTNLCVAVAYHANKLRFEDNDLCRLASLIEAGQTPQQMDGTTPYGMAHALIAEIRSIEPISLHVAVWWEIPRQGLLIYETPNMSSAFFRSAVLAAYSNQGAVRGRQY